jgi:hypothetical protein
MGDFFDGCYRVLKFSFAWINDSSIYLLFGVLAGLSLLATLVSLGAKFEGMLLPAFIITFLIGVVLYYFHFKVILHALSKKGFKTIEYGPAPFLKLILLSIMVSVSVFVPWMEKRLLAAGLILLLPILALVTGMLIAIAAEMSRGAPFLAPDSAAFSLFNPLILLCMMGSFLWFYTYVRLFATTYLYLQGRADGTDAIKKSWALTNAKVGNILGMGLAVAIVLLVALVILSIPLGIVALVERKIYATPVIVTLLGAILFQPAVRFITGYLGVGIYASIDSPKAQIPAPFASSPSPREKPGKMTKKKSPTTRRGR